METAWAVMVCLDQTEGRGPSEAKAYFTEKEDAETCLDGRIGSVIPIQVYSNLSDYAVACLNNIKDRALSKLTLEERKALNL